MRIQKIERRWAREWREYRYVTPKYMKKFALNPPCPRAPLAPGQVADPTSIKRGEDFPEEWAKRQAKLARQAKEAVKKFNEDSATATATEASVKPRKSMPKKPARKPSASPTVPSRQIPHTATATKVLNSSFKVLSSCASGYMSKDCWFLDCLWCFSKFFCCTKVIIWPDSAEDQSNSWTRSSAKSKEETGRIPCAF